MAGGQFATAFATAIERRGLTLERVCVHLREMGTPVSVATLSYWRSGRSQPERPSSLAALRNVERIVRVPEGSLSGLLDEPRPRGWQARRSPQPIDITQLWPDEVAARETLAAVELCDDAELTRLSAHHLLEVDADRVQRSTHVRWVLRAEQDGVDRLVLVHWPDQENQPPPRMIPTRNCTIGETKTDPASQVAVTELLFPQALQKRETIVVEHDVVPVGLPVTATRFERHFRLPVREDLTEVRFDPAALPASCEGYSEIDGERRVRALTVDDAYSVHVLTLDVKPGRFGIRWQWPD